MKTSEIQERVSAYVGVLNDVATVMELPKKNLAAADRQAILKLLDTMTDLSSLMIYHFGCKKLPPKNLAEFRAKVAKLTPQIRT